MKKPIFQTALISLALFGLSFAYSRDEPCYGASGKAHPNGGGFVADTAEVDETAYVDPLAQVCDYVRVPALAGVHGKARLVSFVRVLDNRWGFDGMKVSGFEEGFDNAGVSGWVEVSGREDGDDPRVFGNGELSDDTAGRILVWISGLYLDPDNAEFSNWDPGFELKRIFIVGDYNNPAQVFGNDLSDFLVNSDAPLYDFLAWESAGRMGGWAKDSEGAAPRILARGYKEDLLRGATQ